MNTTLHSIDVILATHNGSKTLPSVLDGYMKQKYEGKWRIIVIENACTDNTRQVIENYKRYLNIIHITEDIPGKNRALNKSIPYISADYAILTDDDTIPTTYYLDEYNKAFNLRKEFNSFSATIEAKWEKQPDDWLLESIPLGTAYGLTSNERHKDGPLPYTHVYGANMAVNSKIFENGFSFDENIGPNGKHYPMGSETEFCQRLEQSGYKTYFCSKPTVYHIIRSHQLHIPWLLGRSFKNGRGAALRNSWHDSKHKYRILGVPSYYITQGTKSFIMLTVTLATFNKIAIMKRLWDFSGKLGKIYQSHITWRSGSKCKS